MGSKPFDRSLASKIIINAANTPPPNVNNGIKMNAFSLIANAYTQLRDHDTGRKLV